MPKKAIPVSTKSKIILFWRKKLAAGDKCTIPDISDKFSIANSIVSKILTEYLNKNK